MSMLEGTMYLPVCFTCNKRVMLYEEPAKGRYYCHYCNTMPRGLFVELYEKAIVREAEMKYKKD